MPYTRAQERAGDIGDLRPSDLADMVVGAARSVLQGMLALLDGTAGHGAKPEPRWVDQRQPRHGEVYDAPSDFDDVPHPGGGRRGWEASSDRPPLRPNLARTPRKVRWMDQAPV